MFGYNLGGLTPAQRIALQQQMTAQHNRAVITPFGAYGRPSVPSVRRDQPRNVGRQYFTLRITNTDATTAHEALVFDAKGLYALATGFVQDPNIIIEGIDEDYQSLLRHLIGGVMYIEQINFETATGKEQQFSRPISYFTKRIGVNQPTLINTLKPGEGVNSMQYQERRTELPVNTMKIGGEEALLTVIEADSYLEMKFFMQQQVVFG